MNPAEVEELVRFTRIISSATLEQLTPIILVTLDGLIDAMRTATGSFEALETAAALSAELHKRTATREPLLAVARTGHA